MPRRSTRDVREEPLYTAAEAARYLRLPASTVRAWVFGQPSEQRGDRRRFEPVIRPADRDARRLSFLNLIELLVLAAIRRKHTVALPQVRRALRFLEKRELLEAYLQCIERDSRGGPVKLYLPVLKTSTVERGVVAIDPRIRFGRPVLDGTGIRTEIIVDRFRAGEPIDSLVSDYGRSREEIEAVVRSELAAAA